MNTNAAFNMHNSDATYRTADRAASYFYKEYSMEKRFSKWPTIANSNSNDGLVAAYGQWIKGYMDKGWSGSLLTFMFQPLPGGHNVKSRQMMDGVERLYSTFLTRAVRNPNSIENQGSLPILLAAPDMPVVKFKKKSRLSDVQINGGLHAHGILLVPAISRLKEPPVEHFGRREQLYVKRPLLGLDIKPINSTPKYVTDYVLKSVVRGKAHWDDILILPRLSGPSLTSWILNGDGDG